jgi:hypothetical protein
MATRGGPVGKNGILEKRDDASRPDMDFQSQCLAESWTKHIFTFFERANNHTPIAIYPAHHSQFIKPRTNYRSNNESCYS